MSRTYYLFTPGRLRRKDNTLAFESGEGRRMIPVEDVDHIYCFSELDLNSKLLDFLGQSQIVLHFFDYYGNYTGSFIPREAQLSGYLIVKQVEHYANEEKRLALAKTIVEGAMHNIRRNLEKRAINSTCEQIDIYRQVLKDVTTIQEVMSVEAHVRKLYYTRWGQVLQPPPMKMGLYIWCPQIQLPIRMLFRLLPRRPMELLRLRLQVFLYSLLPVVLPLEAIWCMPWMQPVIYQHLRR